MNGPDFGEELEAFLVVFNFFVVGSLMLIIAELYLGSAASELKVELADSALICECEP